MSRRVVAQISRVALEIVRGSWSSLQEGLGAFTEAVTEVVSSMVPDWEVTVNYDSPGGMPAAYVQLSHPLSPGFSLRAPANALEACEVEWLIEVIRKEPEFEQLSQAPEMEHVAVVGGIRLMASMFNWWQVEVSTLTGALAEAGCLTREEYEWLSTYTGREMMSPANRLLGARFDETMERGMES